MIKFENTEVMGWKAAIRGMRNPLNSWEKSDTVYKGVIKYSNVELAPGFSMNIPIEGKLDVPRIGPNDHVLMMKLRNAGTDYRKFMRMITVYVDITAPLYWWKEFDTYKIGTVADSCSTMHTIADKEFTLDDFSYEHLINWDRDDDNTCKRCSAETGDGWAIYTPYQTLEDIVIQQLNSCRNEYIKTKDKRYWWQMIQLLPSSYNQKRTVMMNYEVLANIYKSRKNHKLDEWRILCNDWIPTLPYSELITGIEKEKEPQN